MTIYLPDDQDVAPTVLLPLPKEVEDDHAVVVSQERNKRLTTSQRDVIRESFLVDDEDDQTAWQLDALARLAMNHQRYVVKKRTM